jgi:hypothetical protein
VHGQWGDVQGQQHLNHQAPLGQGSQQGGAAPTQQPEGNKGKGAPGGSTLVEISTLPANMVALFQEFLASMAKKEAAAKASSGQ